VKSDSDPVRSKRDDTAERGFLRSRDEAEGGRGLAIRIRRTDVFTAFLCTSSCRKTHCIIHPVVYSHGGVHE
jgi:hypothetical protein